MICDRPYWPHPSQPKTLKILGRDLCQGYGRVAGEPEAVVVGRIAKDNAAARASFLEKG